LVKIAALVCLLIASAPGSTRPHYGGTARVLMQHRIVSLDPLTESDYGPERDRLSALLFETITQIDAQGHVRPWLASSWQADAGQRAWTFQLRLVNFQDGATVTSASVAASLRAASPEWKITVNNRQAFTIETPAPSPHLPELLSLQKFALVKRAADNSLVGTGPYKLGQWQPGEHALFSANDDYWGGRPYLDALEVQMGASLREHLLERNLGRDHAADLSIDQVRALEQTSQGVLTSRPAELLVILFLQSDHESRAGNRRPVEARIREALAHALNRNAISNVLLQKKSVPATALLPQWLTGYEFMFADALNIEQAYKLRMEAGITPPIALAYDFSDPVARMVAERIAVDAREAGITIQPYADPHVNTKSSRKTLNADAVLLRLPLRSLDPSAALAGIVDDLDLPADISNAVLSAKGRDDLLGVERKALADFRVLPVAHVSEALWLNSNVHNWQQLADGEWRLDQVWIEK
jgi:peptide/nickel transport system substrate-binding protein